jgi:pyruvate,water dikinase
MEWALDCKATTVNGYVFVREWSPPAPPPEVLERSAWRVWQENYVPFIRHTCEELRGRDYDKLSAERLHDSLKDALQVVAAAFRLSMLVISANLAPTLELVAFCESKLAEEGPALAAGVLQGFRNETASADLGLGELAELAQRYDGLAACLIEGRFGDIISTEPGGEEFSAGFRDFLSEYGWRSEGFFHPETTTWNEEPEKALALVARYVAAPELSPTRAIARAAVKRKEIVGSIDARLNPDQRPLFQQLVAAAQLHVPVSESRSHWQATLIGSLRVPIVALGRKLVASGVLREANDVFFLKADQVAATVRSKQPCVEEVSRNKAELERWRALAPPPFIGAAPNSEQLPPEVAAVFRHFFGVGSADRQNNVLHGQGASRGIARGRVRILKDLSEAHKLQKGEILVCQTTSPLWTPLFSVAAAVVTDSGGVLSHSAICAREHAVPCVVATQVATSTLTDGSVVTIDGTKGTVTIEDETG